MRRKSGSTSLRCIGAARGCYTGDFRTEYVITRRYRKCGLGQKEIDPEGDFCLMPALMAIMPEAALILVVLIMFCFIVNQLGDHAVLCSAAARVTASLLPWNARRCCPDWSRQRRNRKGVDSCSGSWAATPASRLGSPIVGLAVCPYKNSFLACSGLVRITLESETEKLEPCHQRLDIHGKFWERFSTGFLSYGVTERRGSGS